jgi:hypothetical protein
VAANNDTTVTGHCTKGSGADRIVLPRNSTQTLTSPNNNHPYYGPSGLPVVRSNITIDGNGSTIRRVSTLEQFRILAVADNGNLTLQETTVSGGDAETGLIGDVGGGILNYHGRLNTTAATISRNDATLGGGIHNEQGRLTVTASTISGNSATHGGGGISNESGTFMVVTNSTVSDNTATFGGGMFNSGNSSLILIRTLVSGNTASSAAEIEGGVADRYNLFGHSGETNAQAFARFSLARPTSRPPPMATSPLL